jgi:hypothetical protein
MPRFPKPSFSELLKSYRTDPESVHECKVIDPTSGTVNTCAARMSEALVIADQLVKTRADIAALGNGKGNGKKFLLGTFGYADKLCPHGIARGAQDLGAFLRDNWGQRDKGWTKRADAPPEINGKTGLLLFIKLPGFDGQGHMDLWNKTAAVGHAYWDAEIIWYWELS